MGPGMMGPTPVTAGSPSVTTARARRLAQQFLDARLPGARLEEDTMTFPGYYTLDFTRNGRIAGMVSVNAYTGQVWYHAWHGTFIQEKDLG
jgi:heat shock protein HslJ